MAVTTYFADKLLGVLRGQALTPPSGLWLALHQYAEGSPTTDNELTTALWPAYARRPLGTLTDAWIVSPDNTSVIANANALAFPAVDGASSLYVTGFSLFDALTDGNMLLRASLITPQYKNVGDTVLIAAGLLQIEAV
jgi:hypothetical protein